MPPPSRRDLDNAFPDRILNESPSTGTTFVPDWVLNAIPQQPKPPEPVAQPVDPIGPIASRGPVPVPAGAGGPDSSVTMIASNVPPPQPTVPFYDYVKQQVAPTASRGPIQMDPVTVEGRPPTGSANDNQVGNDNNAGRGGGPIFVPGGWNEALYPFRPETRAKQNEAIDKEERAGENLTDALTRQQDDAAKFYRDQAVDAQARQQVAQEQENAHQSAYKEATTRYQKFVDDASSAKVDPERYMNSQGTGSRILMAIGAALGGFAQGKVGGNNPVLDVMQKNIDRDIAAQEANIANGRWKAGQAANMLGELRASGLDERAARYAIESAQWRIAEQQLKSQMAQTESPIIKARGDALSAEFAQRRVAVDREADMYMHQNPHMAGGPTLSKDELGNMFMGADGQRYVARNAESRKKAADSAETYKNIQSSLDDYKAAVREVGASDRAAYKLGYMTDKMSAAMTAYNHALSPMRQAQHDGVWKKSETEMLAQTLTPPSDFSGNPLLQADLAQKQASEMNNHVMQSEDAVPVRSGFKYNATGNLSPTGQYTGQQQKPARTGMPSGSTKIGP